MLAAVSDYFGILLVIFFAVSAIVARRGAKTLEGSLVVRDGRPALSDEARAKLGKRGLEIAKIEEFIAKTYVVNERGEIVKREEGAEMEAPAPTAPASEPDIFAPAEPEPASGRDERFHSIWEEQDAGPSIWNEADKADFWADEKKSE